MEMSDVRANRSLSTSIDSALDDDHVDFMLRDHQVKVHSVDLSGCLTLIPGGLEITENDLIYVNSSVIVAIGESKLFIADCQLQKFPVIGLYMIQEMRWNRLFRVEFHGVGLEYIEEFEDLFKCHGQGFNAIKSRVKKEQISPKLFSSSERRQVGMKKKFSASLTNFRKRIRPVSEAFTQLKKKSNQKLTKSTENLASIFSPFPKKESSPKHSSSCDASIDDFLDLNELKNEIDKVEKEDQALREMQTLYLQNVNEAVPEEIITQRTKYNAHLAKLRRKFNDLSLLDESTDLESVNQSHDPLSIDEFETAESNPVPGSVRSDDIISRDEIEKAGILDNYKMKPVPFERTGPRLTIGHPSEITWTSPAGSHVAGASSLHTTPEFHRRPRPAPRKLTTVKPVTAISASQNTIQPTNMMTGSSNRNAPIKSHSFCQKPSSLPVFESSPVFQKSKTIPRKPSRTRSQRLDTSKTNSMPIFNRNYNSANHKTDSLHNEASLKKLQDELMQVVSTFGSETKLESEVGLVTINHK